MGDEKVLMGNHDRKKEHWSRRIILIENAFLELDGDEIEAGKAEGLRVDTLSVFTARSLGIKI